MVKYHINPETGNPGICKASKNCPFGDLTEDHFESKDHARLAFELKMKYGDHKPLFTVLDMEVLNDDIKNGFIDVRAHSEDEQLKILCYSKQTQFSGHWTEATKIARGLIVRSDKEDFSDAVIIERPWRKFFTLEQINDSEWVLGDEEREGTSVEAELSRLDFNAPAEVTDKSDGSLGILYKAPDGLPAFSTKGSFGSDQANYYTAMLRGNKQMLRDAQHLVNNHSAKTHLFELVGPANPIVVQYEKEDIVLLGAVEKKTGKYLSPLSQKHNWSGGIVEVMPASNVAEALALPARDNREGVVIRVLSNDPKKQMQLKVKQEDYKILHRAITGYSVSDMRNSIKESGESVSELLEVAKTGDVTKMRGIKAQLELLDGHPLLANVRAERKKSFEESILPRLNDLAEASKRVDALPDSFFKQENPAKAFAMDISAEPRQKQSDMFALFQARLKNQDKGTVSGAAVLKSISAGIKADIVKKWGEE